MKIGLMSPSMFDFPEDAVLDISMNESQESILIDCGKPTFGGPVSMDEHGVNLLIKYLQSLAEDMKREREHREAEKFLQEKRV